MSPTLRLFEGYGIELEYMIVDAETLAVRPLADRLLAAVGGGYEQEVELGPVAWSNELALHVIEFKTNGPAPSLTGVAADLQEHVGRALDLLAPFGARLLPTGMHPWMDPDTELRLWPHEGNVVYATFDRIFDCRGHGWANLQSMHVNLPFTGDDEFGRLHAAIRMVLPLLPGIAASSPFVGGRRGPGLDTRLTYYRTNSAKVFEVTGHVVPEAVFTQADYEEDLLGSIYRALAPLDPDGVLRNEWVNARGAIARFDRMAIEIRLLDLQECPRADLAVAAAVTAAVRAHVEEAWCSTSVQRAFGPERLAGLLSDSVVDADEAIIRDREFLDAFGVPGRGALRVRDVWQHVIETRLAAAPGFAEWQAPLATILDEGCLARRIVRAAGDRPGPDALRAVYARLADGLAEGASFRP